MTHSTTHIFIGLFLLLVVGCQSRFADEQTTTLTVQVYEQPDAHDIAYPLQLTIAGETGLTRHNQQISQAGTSVDIQLPAWARYHIVLRSDNGYSAFCECLLYDRPTTVVLMLSTPPEPSNPDTIHIDWDDSPTTEAPVHVDAIPSVCSIWQGHVVALVDSLSPTESQLTLLSLREWDHMPSANHESRSTYATSIAANYIEQNLSQWQMPASEQAKALQAAYLGGSLSFDRLNALFESCQAPTIQLRTGSDNARYLCDQGTRSFSFVANTKISNAGTKVTTYHMRLVRTIRVTTANTNVF